MRRPRLAFAAAALLIAWTLHQNLSVANPDPDLVSVFAQIVPQLPDGQISFKPTMEGEAGRLGRYAHHSLVLAAAPRAIPMVGDGPPSSEWAIGYRVGAIRGYQVVEQFGSGVRLYRRRQ